MKGIISQTNSLRSLTFRVLKVCHHCDIDCFESNLHPSLCLQVQTHLGGAGSTRADVTGSEHLLIAQDATASVLLVVQELLESGAVPVDGCLAANLLQQPAHLILVVLHLGGSWTGSGGNWSQKWGREKREVRQEQYRGEIVWGGWGRKGGRGGSL